MEYNYLHYAGIWRPLLHIDKIIVGQLEVNCYIVSDKETSEAVIVDPGDEFERIAGLVDSVGVKPVSILCTHAHYDHICAAKELQDRYRCPLVMHEEEKTTYEMTKRMCLAWGFEPEDFPPPDMTVKGGDKIRLGAVFLEVVHTPGHSPGSVCLFGERFLFSGDTLFRRSVGRTDLSGGSKEKLIGSLKSLLTLPPDTRVLCGHGEETTLGEESSANPFILRWLGHTSRTAGA
jgi:hydroxyacylglutathione hydrolase